MTLTAYKYTTERTHIEHLRVKQSQYSDGAKERLKRIGSPARWIPGKWEWDCPLTPASVIALDAAAKDLGEVVIWEGDLKSYADDHLRQSETEHAVRIGIERVIRENIPLEPYTTRMTDDYGKPLPPLRHQAISWHWSQRVRGLLLAHDPGVGKTRSATDAAGGWYRNNIIRPMTPAFLGGRHGVQGGVLVVAPKTMLKTWQVEVAKWQNAQGVIIDGSSTKKQRLAAQPAHFHITNYEGLKYITHNEYDGLIIDECFPPGTPVATPEGPRAIESICVGDTVLAYNHDTSSVVARRVTDVFCNPRRTRLARIRTNRGGLVCTANHPVWTARGYTPACQVVKGDVVDLLRSDPLRGVRGAEPAAEGSQGVLPPEEVLLARVPEGDPGADAGGDQPAAGSRADAEPESNAQARVPGPGLAEVAGDEARAARPGREWSDDHDRVDALRSVERRASGLVYAPDPQDQRGERPPQRAQARLVEPLAEGGCGTERGLPWGAGASGAGCAEDRVLAGARVEGVDLYEPRGEGYNGEGGPNDIEYVHNIGVEEQHNYFAGGAGFLVHNCHRCSNSTTQTHNVLGVAQKARRVMGLSGTPISNSLESIFFPSLIIDGGKALGPSRTAFTEKFFKQIAVGGGFHKNVPLEDSVRKISEKIASFTYFVKKEEVLDLPPKTHSPVYLEMTDEQLRYYNQIKHEAVTYIQDVTISVEQAAARMMKLMQICQGFALDGEGNGRHFTDAKTVALTELLTNELSSRKVVVWGYFNYEIARLVQMLTERGIPHIRIDGTVTSQKLRDESMERWNSDPTLRVYIRQLAMSEGVTLHAKDSEVPCFDCIYLGLSYRYVDWKQSQDRIHRIGQRFACNYTYYLTTEGIDRAVYNSVLAKDATAGQVQQITKDYYLSLLTAKVA